MSNTVKFIGLAILLFGGLFFLINSEYASAKLDTIQKVIAGIFLVGFVVGIFIGLNKKPKS